MAKSSPPNERPPRFVITPHYVTTVILSWLVPGAGHWILGYRTRAVLIGGVLLGTFWVGETALAGNLAVTREVHPVFFGLQAGNGLSAFVADALWGDAIHSENNNEIRADLPPLLNLGILFASVSGLLNFLVILHILDPRTWREAAAEGEKEAS